VPGASVPQPFGGRYRQIMIYVDPLKLEAHQLSVMDIVRTVNDANLILPAGDVKIGPYDYNLYVNSQINDMKDINQVPLKTIGNASVLIGDVGHDERIKREAQDEDARDSKHRSQRTKQCQTQVTFVMIQHLLELAVKPPVETRA